MYTYGDTAASPALAKLAPGNIIIKNSDRLGVQEATWRSSINQRPGDSATVIDRLTLIEAEEFAGQWEIGVPDGEKYRAAKSL
jgi:hypothetical protein